MLDWDTNDDWDSNDWSEYYDENHTLDFEEEN